ncbi:hypothetical protein KKC59_02520 [bacterium]|nr:hypothetical protein [bacterium]
MEKLKGIGENQVYSESQADINIIEYLTKICLEGNISNEQRTNIKKVFESLSSNENMLSLTGDIFESLIRNLEGINKAA